MWAKESQASSDFQIDRLVVGPLMTNCYILSSGGECLILDPGDDAARILQRVSDSHLKLRAVVSTHGHFDHLLAAGKVSKELGVPFCLHILDRTFQNDFSPLFKLAWGCRARIVTIRA